MVWFAMCAGDDVLHNVGGGPVSGMAFHATRIDQQCCLALVVFTEIFFTPWVHTSLFTVSPSDC
jgi:hypothetical protein